MEMEDPGIDLETSMVFEALDGIREIDKNYTSAAERFLRFPRPGNAEFFSNATENVIAGNAQLVDTVLSVDMTAEEKAKILSSSLHESEKYRDDQLSRISGGNFDMIYSKNIADVEGVMTDIICKIERHYEGFQEENEDDTEAVHHYVNHLRDIFTNSATTDTYSFLEINSNSIQLKTVRFLADHKESINKVLSTAIGISIGGLIMRQIARKNN